jgi:hypothetical protein
VAPNLGAVEAHPALLVGKPVILPKVKECLFAKLYEDLYPFRLVEYVNQIDHLALLSKGGKGFAGSS